MPSSRSSKVGGTARIWLLLALLRRRMGIDDPLLGYAHRRSIEWWFNKTIRGFPLIMGALAAATFVLFLFDASDVASYKIRSGRAVRPAYAWGEAFNNHRGFDEIVDILTRTTSVKDKALYDKIVSASVDPNGRLNVPSLVEAQDWFAAHGYIPQKVDVAALIDYQFVDYAVSVLGESR